MSSAEAYHQCNALSGSKWTTDWLFSLAQSLIVSSKFGARVTCRHMWKCESHPMAITSSVFCTFNGTITVGSVCPTGHSAKESCPVAWTSPNAGIWLGEVIDHRRHSRQLSLQSSSVSQSWLVQTRSLTEPLLPSVSLLLVLPSCRLVAALLMPLCCVSFCCLSLLSRRPQQRRLQPVSRCNGVVSRGMPLPPPVAMPSHMGHCHRGNSPDWLLLQHTHTHTHTLNRQVQ